jgi:ceramide glucosyltransferase
MHWKSLIRPSGPPSPGGRRTPEYISRTFRGYPLTLLYVICGVALLQGIVSLLQGFPAFRHIRTYRPRSNWRPRVVVFCPCKGVDDGFEKNIASILKQDYPHLRVVFIVDSEFDPALPILKQSNASVLSAGPAAARGQKVHNLIHAVEHAAGDAEVFVFCDADARFPQDWITNLIAPLEQSSVAVATGYRWYAAETGSLPSLLRSTWNASAVTMLGDHDRNFAWGGSTAIRRDVFERIGVRDAWDGALSDDYAVTLAARRANMRIDFVPACLVPSYGDTAWRDLLEFTTRQLVITRVYEPRMWRMAFFSQTVFNVAFWSGIFLPGRLSLVTLGIYFLAGIKSYMRYNAVANVLPESALSKQRWSYILLAPLTALLFEYNLVLSALTRKIKWRQIRYRLISSNRTEVLRGGDGS